MIHPVTILYVDDEPINLMLFEAMFKKNYNVILADSGLHGLKILAEKPEIKVIISDMKMPGMNGLEFIQKARVLFPDILYFILTGYEITPEIQRSLEQGIIAEYFQKPFNMKSIDLEITKRLSIR
jgi:two-component system, response regulator, stage 0 sporulation protein F